MKLQILIKNGYFKKLFLKGNEVEGFKMVKILIFKTVLPFKKKVVFKKF